MAQKRAIVVGVGSISAAWFPPLIAEGVEIPAVVDLRPDLAKERLAKYPELAKTKVSDKLKATLRKYKPDFVIDLTIPDAHCAVTCTALRAGYHVVGEKPMAGSMAAARKMVKTAEETGKMYMVSQSRRWDVNDDTVRATIASGAIGDLTTFNCDFYVGAHFGGFRDEMPSPLILDMAIHHFDLARFMSGKDPVAVYALEFNPKGSWYKGDVAASCIFEMSDGVVFTYRGSWCAEGCHTSWNGDWRYIGNQGTLLYAGDKTPHGQVVEKQTAALTWPLKDLQISPSPVQHFGMHGALCEMLTFLDGGPVPQTECHDNIKSLAMVFSVIESSKKGRRVPVRA